MKERIIQEKKEFDTEIKKVKTLEELDIIKHKYIGKKGSITLFSKEMGTLDQTEKKEIGQYLNQVKQNINEQITHITTKMKTQKLNDQLNNETIDVTMPGIDLKIGTTHPLTRVIEEVEDIFVSMGYNVASGPEIELDMYNFEKLNLPKDHPARDTQDSFYINAERLLRTQTSPVQARTMDANKEKSPIRVICPGKVYRKDDDDATHSHQFTQIEGLLIDKDISLAHLKGTLELAMKQLFGKDREIRLRPNYFPFTEPSLEIDVSCFKCGGQGCKVCKNTGWIEILGAGMVHPNVLKSCGYDPEKYTGFAFGMGPERIAMLKYGINDIRDFYTNDIRFLETFDRAKGGLSYESK